MIKRKFFLAFFLFTFMLGYGQERTFSYKVNLKSPPVGLSDNTDIIGLWHNEAVESVLNRLANSPFLPQQSEFDSLLITSLEEFCLTKGINVKLDFTGDYDSCLYDTDNIDICSSQELSAEANNIVCRIKSNVDNFVNETISLESFTEQAENLRLESEALTNEGERKVCGITASVSNHSIRFWNENFDRYYNIFKDKTIALKGIDDLPISMGPNSDGLLMNDVINEKKALRIRWGLVGLADVSGAWTWARACLPLAGVLGAAAGGFAGACGHSLVSLISQSIASLF